MCINCCVYFMFLCAVCKMMHSKGWGSGLPHYVNEHLGLKSTLSSHATFSFQVQAVLKRKEEEDQQMKQVVKTLQLALDKEKTKVKDLKEQVGGLSPP